MSMSDQELVNELCEIDSGLTDWELDFVESLSRKILRWPFLTPVQRGKAMQILEEKG